MLLNLRKLLTKTLGFAHHERNDSLLSRRNLTPFKTLINKPLPKNVTINVTIKAEGRIPENREQVLTSFKNEKVAINRT
jgi:hypothetical protein